MCGCECYSPNPHSLSPSLSKLPAPLFTPSVQAQARSTLVSHPRRCPPLTPAPLPPAEKAGGPGTEGGGGGGQDQGTLRQRAAGHLRPEQQVHRGHDVRLQQMPGPGGRAAQLLQGDHVWRAQVPEHRQRPSVSPWAAMAACGRWVGG